MFSKLTKKVFRCPQCTQKLRIPIKPGKTLRITCNKCKVQFDVSYKSPIFEIFQWEKGRTFKYNIEGLNLRFKAMQFNDKVNAILTILIMVIFMNLVAVGIFKLIQSNSQNDLRQIVPESNEHYEVI